jgi:hypothetical protein
MCPSNARSLLLLVSVIVFAFFWLKRQRRRAAESFESFSGLLELPHISESFPGISMELSGFYRGRKFVWPYNVFDEEDQIQISIEPKCAMHLKVITLTDPKPTAETYARGRRIVYWAPALRKSGSLLRFDPVPLVSAEDARHVLEELSKAAEIVEAKGGSIC